jgi:hypothetical protein
MTLWSLFRLILPLSSTYLGRYAIWHLRHVLDSYWFPYLFHFHQIYTCIHSALHLPLRQSSSPCWEGHSGRKSSHQSLNGLLFKRCPLFCKFLFSSFRKEASSNELSSTSGQSSAESTASFLSLIRCLICTSGKLSKYDTVSNIVSRLGKRTWGSDPNWISSHRHNVKMSESNFTVLRTISISSRKSNHFLQIVLFFHNNSTALTYHRASFRPLFSPRCSFWVKWGLPFDILT